MRRRGWLVIGAASAALFACSSDDKKVTPDGGTTGDAAITEGGAADTTVSPDTASPDADLSKKPAIDKMVPSDGFADGGRNGATRVTLIGRNFTPNMTVYIDGGQEIITTISFTSNVSASFLMPKNPYGPPYVAQKVTVQVRAGKLGSNVMDFQYTEVKALDDNFTAELVTKQANSYRDFRSEVLLAKIFAKGVTDTSNGGPGKLVAQVGIGKVGDDPTKDYSFTWFGARYSEDSTTDTGYDVYQGSVIPVLETDYDVAWRFSTDDGKTWIYADGNASDKTYSTADAGKLKVTKAPQNYCTKDADCLTSKYQRSCLIDQIDSKNNRCVECQADKDCTGNPSALGPTCDTQNYFCICSKDADCSTNKNGKVCVGSQSGYCGCTKDGDCDWQNGEACTQDQQNQINICAPAP